MKFTCSNLLLTLAGTAALLTGCGGGGGSTVPETNTPALSSVPVTVIDGAIKNATVCLDKNLNGACDSDEPSGKTDAAGNVILQVAAQDAGKFPILAQVGTDAVDADHGPVTTAFVMKAPADKPAVVSPLTTLVQTTIESSGASTAAAEAAVQAQIGLNVSLFQDFTKSSTSESANLGTIARMVVVTTQEQTNTLAGAVGTRAIDGSAITQVDLNKAIERKLLEVLPSIIAALADPRVQSAGTPAAKAQALTDLAKELVASPTTGLTTTTLATLVGIAKQVDSVADTATTATAGATLSGLNFSNVQNWFRRVFTSSVAQSTPDASSNVRFIDRRSRSTSGQTANWTAGGDPARQSDLHWNGTAWGELRPEPRKRGFPARCPGPQHL